MKIVPAGGGQPRNVSIIDTAASEFGYAWPWFLPDGKHYGKYVAYVSNESGNREIYVKMMNGTGGKWQISTENADNPRWNGDGTELFYLTRDHRIMAVKVNTGGKFEVGNAIELFQHRIQYPGGVNWPYDVTADG